MIWAQNPICRLHNRGGGFTGLVLMVVVSCIEPELASPPFKNNYRFEINTSHIQPTKGIAEPFACSWSSTRSVACSGTACGGQPLSCARVNASATRYRFKTVSCGGHAHGLVEWRSNMRDCGVRGGGDGGGGTSERRRRIVRTAYQAEVHKVGSW
jgi:uncharacterized membrane protein YgcG